MRAHRVWGRRPLSAFPDHNLPARLTSFVGREQEQVDVAVLLASTPLVTLIGAPGVGKTRLGLEIVTGLLDRFPVSSLLLPEAASGSYRALSELDPTVPVASLPPAVQAAVNAHLAALPVTGSLKIQGSPCCIGSSSSTTKATVTFSATSPHPRVTEMRRGTGGCGTGHIGTTKSDWQPVASSLALPVSVISGWSTFAVAVQYRDAAGNLSTVVCDSIGVEGMPPRRP